ncbi:MAG: M20/M25/M40 family metallo-hydrolase [Thermoanaerobaculia bacterium]|nr:M20/M25/M40 family metallo-hydrolase [Thermoanaerobaculia bacterium]
MIYRLLQLGLMMALIAHPLLGGELTRPDVTLQTSEAYDFGEISEYDGSHPAVYDYIDNHLDRHVSNLQRWVRQRSISAQDVGIDEMAAMLREDLLELGFQEAEVVPTAGHPGVWGYYDAGAEKTLALYLMYDVQPVEPEDWQVDPFAGEIIAHEMGRVLMARAATNQKGPQRAFLNALESIIAVDGTLPVNLMVAAEGEEELGSPNYPEFIQKYADRLRTADGVFFPFNAQDPSGDVSMFLGVKGILYVEMEATGGEHGGPTNAEIHGSYKAVVDSPVWRLVQALASLTDEAGNTIQVEGYYDAVRPPTHSEELLINAMLDDYEKNEPMMMKSLGVDRWIEGKRGKDTLLEYLYTPTLNIDGIWGGYTGEGVKTILPHRATAKVDSRLVPDQTPEEALELIRSHLDEHGFSDIEIRKLSGYPPAQTDVESELVQTAISVYKKYGGTPSVAPRIGGSAPYYIFTDVLGLPLVAGGLGFGTGAHAPNEFMVIESTEGSGVAGLAEVEKFYVDLLYALAD